MANTGYYNGVSSAITTQSEVTLNCRAEHGEMTIRRTNMTRPGVRNQSYPGGEDINNLHITTHELVFGWVTRQGRNQIPGHPNQIGFSSLNGLKWGAFSTNEELEMAIRFIGLAKTPFFFENSGQLKHGFACIGVGSGTTFHTGEEDIYPGDRLEWSVVPRPTKGRFLDGGKFGDNGPGSRQGNPTEGTPRSKLRFRVNPSRYNDMKPSLNAAVSAMKKTYEQGGCSDLPYEALFSAGLTRRKPTPAVEYAMAQLYTDVVGAVRVISVLNARGIVTNGGQVELVDRIGLFNTDPAQRDTVNAIIDALYMSVRSNGQASRVAFEQFKNNVPGGFSQGRLKRDVSTASRYAQIASNFGNLQAVAYARAVHCVARRRFATSLSFSKPGQQLDVLIGHFLESF